MEIEEVVDDEIKDVKGKKLSENEIKDLKGKKLSGRKLRRYDSLDIEANAIPDRQCQGSKVSFSFPLAYSETFILNLASFCLMVCKSLFLFFFLHIFSCWREWSRRDV